MRWIGIAPALGVPTTPSAPIGPHWAPNPSAHSTTSAPLPTDAVALGVVDLPQPRWSWWSGGRELRARPLPLIRLRYLANWNAAVWLVPSMNFNSSAPQVPAQALLVFQM